MRPADFWTRPGVRERFGWATRCVRHSRDRGSEPAAHDPLLDHLRQLVGHLRSPALSGPQHLKAMPVDLTLPGVVGGAVHPKCPARSQHTRPRCLPRTIAGGSRTARHPWSSGSTPLHFGGEGGSLSRGADGFPAGEPVPPQRPIEEPPTVGSTRRQPTLKLHRHQTTPAAA
jgi:hypothetical protein